MTTPILVIPLLESRDVFPSENNPNMGIYACVLLEWGEKRGPDSVTARDREETRVRCR